VDVDLVSFTANGKHAIDIGETGTWDGTSVLKFTTGSRGSITLAQQQVQNKATSAASETTILSSYGGQPPAPHQGKP